MPSTRTSAGPRRSAKCVVPIEHREGGCEDFSLDDWSAVAWIVSDLGLCSRSLPDTEHRVNMPPSRRGECHHGVMGAVSLRTAGAVVGLCVGSISITACATSSDQPSGQSSTSLVSNETVAEVAWFVLPGNSRSLLDSEVGAPPAGLLNGFAFAPVGSPDDDVDGARVGAVLFDPNGQPMDDNRFARTDIDVDGRPFWWISDAENTRIYAGPTESGQPIGMITLNVDEPVAVDLLSSATWREDRAAFDGEFVPDGWVDIGTTLSVMQFVAGATGSNPPMSGMRSLYGDPAAVEDPSWDDIIAVDGVTLSTWIVTSRDPANEARYSLDSEIEVEVQRADGSFATGFASAPNNEFIEYVVWQDGETWLALSRAITADISDLIELASTVRIADADETTQLGDMAAS